MAIVANLTELTAIIVASFVSNNTLKASEIPALIVSTHNALLHIDAVPQTSSGREKPAVPVWESITDEYLVCLDDGKRLRTLKRYLKRKFSLSPDEYRKKWGLPEDYPMVAPGYAELRSRIAKRKTREASNAPESRTS
ncbi:MucR family transcriptional regulator [Bradyrhizobium canariense]|uniref:Transcriptional regulator, MucR family n=1 Tax=Bradyrhizobium canariense TaxID=255045 RepID=A0A1H2AHR5_9BRAD|nr:MucR family transcriptional regulator [Bradyrhizobium canariense]SDT45302.1 transcriptional regulator, MucR family [Bradyrhizobium canariense]